MDASVRSLLGAGGDNRAAGLATGDGQLREYAR
jgi:hypothetical protein